MVASGDAPPPGSTPEAPGPDGLVLQPFRALRYADRQDGALANVTSPPYDVLDEDAVRRYERQDPHNVVRLILPRDLDGEPGTRYRVAARTLADWRTAGVLRAEPAAALYVYEEATDSHVQRGLVGAVGLAPPAENIILPHENTMVGPVADRLALTVATGANLEPIFLVYDGGGAASAAVADVATAQPLVGATTEDGVRHTLWALRDPATLAAVAADLRPRRAVIADGHHRYATYLQFQAGRHSAGHGPGPWDYGLALLVDSLAFGPEVAAIHRVLRGLPLPVAAEQARRAFRLTEIPAAQALSALAAAGAGGSAGADGAARPAFLLAADGRFVLLSDPDPAALAAAVGGERSPAWRGLDVTVAHTLLVSTLWDLPDREDVVGFAHDVDEAIQAARATGGTALLLNPTPVDAVAAVAAAGDRMPRKSTLFTPKPRTGLLIRAFADA